MIVSLNWIHTILFIVQILEKSSLDLFQSIHMNPVHRGEYQGRKFKFRAHERKINVLDRIQAGEISSGTNKESQGLHC
jgi:hypothetical protein